MPVLNPDADTVWFAYPLILKENCPFSRTELQIFLEKRNIQTRVIFTGNILRQPGFKKIKKRIIKSGYPNADYIMKNGLLIAAHHGMTNKMLNHIHNSFKVFASKY